MCPECCPDRCSWSEVTVHAWLLLNYWSIIPSLLPLSPSGSQADQRERSVSSLILYDLIIYIYNYCYK